MHIALRQQRHTSADGAAHRWFDGARGASLRMHAMSPWWALAMAVALLGALAVAPSGAFAKSYTMPQVSISAQLNADGSLHVVEQRTFDFDGSFTAVWWELGALPPAAQASFNGMRMGLVPEDGGQAQLNEVAEVPFQAEWRTAGGPGTTAYSVDASQDTCYLFFDVSDATMVAEVDYTIENAATRYADCAELYWKFVADGWQESSRNVTCAIGLPAPEGETAVPGDTVRAWGHGPLAGEVAFSDDARQVSFEVDSVQPGSFAEARVVLPAEWLDQVDPEVAAATEGQQHLDEVLQEEQEWADEANLQRQRSLAGVLASVLAALALVVWGFVMFFRHGREHQPTFRGDYWRDDPDAGTHPAVVSRLWTFDKRRTTDFTATIMHLANEGALRIDKGTYETSSRLGRPKQVDDYYLTRLPDYQPTNAIDQEALDFLFKKVSKDGNQLWLGEIAIWGKKNAESFVNAMDRWQGEVTKAVEERDYFEAKGASMQVATALVASAALFVGIVASMYFDNFVPVVALGVAAGILYILAVFMPRRTYDGVDVYARCAALRKWLTEFSLLDERPPTDVKVWGEFMVFAYIFGVADRVLKELRTTVPEAFEQDYVLASTGDARTPWYHMYDIDGVSRHASFSVMMDNTLEMVSEAISSAADGGGGGGGFSGGGGGGFGGGGGGGAR